jgi:putative nucleotidyltransferase with HDIG domain
MTPSLGRCCWPRAAVRRAGLEVVEQLPTISIHAANRTALRAVKRLGYRRAVTLEPWAEAQVERLIAPLGNRWAHVQAVAHQARRVAAVLSGEDGDVLVAAALLHDIGYAPSLARLGFHPVDGARFLRDHGQERLACLVAHHSGARFEAQERGLVDELAAFPVEEGPVMDALTFADMTTGPAGQPMTLDQRVDEILRRYPPDDPVYRAIVRARPLLKAAVERTWRRLNGGSRQPI